MPPNVNPVGPANINSATTSDILQAPKPGPLLATTNTKVQRQMIDLLKAPAPATVTGSADLLVINATLASTAS